MRTFAWATLALLTGCTEGLVLPPPTTTYQAAEGKAPVWTRDERTLADQVEARLAAEGFPKAEPGGYETQLAALEVAVLRAKRWGTTGRESDPGGVFVADPDEEQGTDVAKTHIYHRLLARGVEDLSNWSAGHVDDFAKHRLWQSDLDKLWPWLRPSRRPYGALRLGVAVLGDGIDSKRYFAVVLRDDRFELTQGPPRKAEPGTSFTLRGLLRDDGLKPLTLGVSHPDGTVDLKEVNVSADGSFEASYELPQTPGRYLVGLRGTSSILWDLPVFAGIPAAPWPAEAAKNVPDPATTRDALTELAKDIAGFRKAQKLPEIPISASLCALSKAEAKRYADQDAAPMTAERAEQGENLRLKAAGLDPDKTFLYHWRVSLSPPDENSLHHSFENFVAALPWGPFSERRLRSTKVTQFGFGAVPEAQKHDDDPKFVDIVWIATEGAAASAAR